VTARSRAGDASQAVPSTLGGCFLGWVALLPGERGGAASPACCICSLPEIPGRQTRSGLPVGLAASLIVQEEQLSKGSLLLAAKCQSLVLAWAFSNSIKS